MSLASPEESNPQQESVTGPDVPELFFPISDPVLPPPASYHSPPISPSSAARHPPRFSAVWLGIAFETGLGVLALALAWCFGQTPLARIQGGVAPVLVSLLATVPLLAALAVFLSFDWKFVRELRDLMNTFVLPLFASARWWELALLCTAAGFGEELLFRGVLQPLFCGALGLGVGIALANVLFGLMHAFSITYVVLAGSIGLYLSVLFVTTDNLLPPILAHGLYDFLALAWMTWQKRLTA